MSRRWSSLHLQKNHHRGPGFEVSCCFGGGSQRFNSSSSGIHVGPVSFQPDDGTWPMWSKKTKQKNKTKKGSTFGPSLALLVAFKTEIPRSLARKNLPTSKQNSFWTLELSNGIFPDTQPPEGCVYVMFIPWCCHVGFVAGCRSIVAPSFTNPRNNRDRQCSLMFAFCLLLRWNSENIYIHIWCFWNGYNLLWWCTVAGFFKEKVKQIYVKSSCCNYRFVMMCHPWRLSIRIPLMNIFVSERSSFVGILNFPSYILHYIRTYILYIYTHIDTLQIYIYVSYTSIPYMSLSLSLSV